MINEIRQNPVGSLLAAMWIGFGAMGAVLLIVIAGILLSKVLAFVLVL
jgi:hypothetical protein